MDTILDEFIVLIRRLLIHSVESKEAGTHGTTRSYKRRYVRFQNIRD